jgi:hypothetical protein
MPVTEVAFVCIWRIVPFERVAMFMKFYSGFL